MISAAEYQRRLQKVNKITVLRELAYEQILKDESTLKMLKEQDFKEGDIYGDGSRVGYNSEAYAAMKERMNPLAGGAVDLILSGSFVDAMFIKKPIGNVYQFGNRNWKRPLLEEKYPRGIFGLNQNVFLKYQKEILAPRFIRSIKSYAGIG